MRALLSTASAARIWIVMSSGRAPRKIVISLVLAEDEVASVPPVLAAGILLEDHDRALPVVAVVVVFLVVKVVDDAP